MQYFNLIGQTGYLDIEESNSRSPGRGQHLPSSIDVICHHPIRMKFTTLVGYDSTQEFPRKKTANVITCLEVESGNAVFNKLYEIVCQLILKYNLTKYG